MLPQFIYYLIQYIKFQERIIFGLLGIVLGKSVARGLYDEPINKPYRKFEVDDMPIIEILEKLDYQEKNGQELKPIARHKNSVVTVPTNLTCPTVCGSIDSILINHKIDHVHHGKRDPL